MAGAGDPSNKPLWNCLTIHQSSGCLASRHTNACRTGELPANPNPSSKQHKDHHFGDSDRRKHAMFMVACGHGLHANTTTRNGQAPTVFLSCSLSRMVSAAKRTAVCTTRMHLAVAPDS